MTFFFPFPYSCIVDYLVNYLMRELSAFVYKKRSAVEYYGLFSQLLPTSKGSLNYRYPKCCGEVFVAFHQKDNLLN